MAYKFKCEHCGEELLVHYLKIGEEAQCPSCRKSTVVPEDAEYANIPGGKPRPRPLGEKVWNQSEAAWRQSHAAEQSREREVIKQNAVKKVVGSRAARAVKVILNGAWWLVIINCAVLLLLMVFGGVTPLRLALAVYGVGVDVRWDHPIGLETGVDADSTNSIYIEGHPMSRIQVPDDYISIWADLGQIIVGISVIAVVFLLRRVFRGIASGEPFRRRNSLYLRWTGYLIIMVEVLDRIVNYCISAQVIGDLSIPGAKLSAKFDWDFSGIFIGLVIVAIAHLFELAARIQREQELTI